MIQKLLPGFPLVMHGSSSVPKEWVDRINAAGGDMPGASGVPEDQYLPAAKLGVAKVNIDTDGRLVWCAIHREFFKDKPAEFDLRGPGKPFRPGSSRVCATRSRSAPDTTLTSTDTSGARATARAPFSHVCQASARQAA